MERQGSGIVGGGVVLIEVVLESDGKEDDGEGDRPVLR